MGCRASTQGDPTTDLTANPMYITIGQDMTDGLTDRTDRRLETWLASSPTRIAPPTRGVQACEPTTHTQAWDGHDRAGL